MTRTGAMEATATVDEKEGEEEQGTEGDSGKGASGCLNVKWIEIIPGLPIKLSHTPQKYYIIKKCFAKLLKIVTRRVCMRLFKNMHT